MRKNSVGKSEEKTPFGDLCIKDRIILRRILWEQGVREWAEFIWLGIASISGSCEHGN
jgi:hypothetical protein